MEIKTVKILGQEYTIHEYSSNEEIFDTRLNGLHVQGFTDSWDKVIGYIRYNEEDEQEEGSCKNLSEYSNKILRHEIIHAFLFESGLTDNAQEIKAWATNEEMVDFFSQFNFLKCMMCFWNWVFYKNLIFYIYNDKILLL